MAHIAICGILRVKRLHPDRNSAKDAGKQFMQMKSAYNELENYIDNPSFLTEYRQYLAAMRRAAAPTKDASQSFSASKTQEPLHADSAHGFRGSFEHRMKNQSMYRYTSSPFEDLDDFYSTYPHSSSFSTRKKYFWERYKYSFSPFFYSSYPQPKGRYDEREWYTYAGHVESMPPPLGSPFNLLNVLGFIILLAPALYLGDLLWRSRRRSFWNVEKTRTFVALELKYHFLSALKNEGSTAPLAPPSTPLLQSLNLPLDSYLLKGARICPSNTAISGHQSYSVQASKAPEYARKQTHDASSGVKEDSHYYYRKKDITNVLHRAVIAHDFAEALQLLLDGCHPSLPDRKRRTPLHYAAYSGQLDLCRLLLIFNADPLARDAFHECPLDTARLAGRLDVETLLLYAVTGNYTFATEFVLLRNPKESYVALFRMVEPLSVTPFGVPEEIRTELKHMLRKCRDRDHKRPAFQK